MSIVNCNRAEVVECSCLKPCWSGAGRGYLLMVGRISFQRLDREARYEALWEVSLPGLDIEEGGDILNRSVENAEFIGAKCLTISTALDCFRKYGRVKVSAISIGFLLLSLVTNRVSLEEKKYNRVPVGGDPAVL